MKYTIFILLLIINCSCDSSTSVENTTNTEVINTNSEALEMLPPLPEEQKLSLLENADYIDYIFYPYGKTINQGDKGSIRQMIQQITTNPQPTINCATPFCKISFYKMPNVLIETEVHYGNGCAYFVFHDADGKPQYANKMGEFGITFFNKIITQFEAK